MKKFILASAIAALSASSAFAQTESTTSFPSSTTANVHFEMTADFASLREKEKNPIDVIEIKISDSRVITVLKLECQGGKTKFFVKVQDRTCKVTGDGYLVNPKNPSQTLHRVKYQGALITDSDGLTDARELKVNYLALNGAAPSKSEFTGSLYLKPENTPKDAQAYKDNLLKMVAGEGKVLVDKRLDTISYNRFGVPSQGLNTDRGCIWNDNMGYAYQAELWDIDLKAQCTDKDGKVVEYKLKGNMPYSINPEGKAQYSLTLNPPSATATSDEVLFASNDDDDLFSVADGITAVINMEEDKIVETIVDGQKADNASHIVATATFTGTNIPENIVRSFVRDGNGRPQRRQHLWPLISKSGGASAPHQT